MMVMMVMMQCVVYARPGDTRCVNVKWREGREEE